MNIDLHIENIAPNEWKFVASFLNKGPDVEVLPFDAINRNGVRMGLQFLIDGHELEPTEFAIISPKQQSRDIELPPGSSVEFEFLGRVEEKAKAIFALCFKNEAYKVELDDIYQVKFAWGRDESDAIEWCPRSFENSPRSQ